MSELRQDLVSGDWIIVAPERAKRPHDFLPKKLSRKPSPKSTCPLEDLEAAGNWPPILVSPNRKNWEVAVVPNKYPALVHKEKCAKPLQGGPYRFYQGIGHHDLVITRGHRKNVAWLSLRKAVDLFRMFQRRYLMLAGDPCLDYVATWFNWGPTAGASVYHPHYQMLSLPIIPPDIAHSLRGSHAYFRTHHRCVHCEMLKFEARHKKRIVEENRGAVAVAPYVSRQPFELRVYPKRHLSVFERTRPADLTPFVAVLQSALRRIKRYLNDPDLNLFIHTAPLRDQRQYRHYHWHVEILPKISIPAGFELGTGVDIDVIDPDRAAAILRGNKV